MSRPHFPLVLLTLSAATCGVTSIGPSQATDTSPTSSGSSSSTISTTANSTSATTTTTGSTTTAITGTTSTTTTTGTTAPLDTETNSTDSGTTDTSATTSSTVCGNGIKEFDEECDDGNDENTDACAGCKKAACGDGFVWADHETCDEGANANGDPVDCRADCTYCGDTIQQMDEDCDDGNNDGSYGGCATDCKALGPHCGDDMQNGPEECDDGNMTNDDDCSNECIAPRIVFVTSKTFTGDLGGLAGADKKCNDAAMTANLPGIYLAWLSDGTPNGNPKKRFNTNFSGSYRLTNGTNIATGWSDLADGALDAAINVDESKETLIQTKASWSNTKSDGTPLVPDKHCNNWTSNDNSLVARIGGSSHTDGRWTDLGAQSGEKTCNSSYRLFCFQDKL